jgi:hypothetical protein
MVVIVVLVELGVQTAGVSDDADIDACDLSLQQAAEMSYITEAR